MTKRTACRFIIVLVVCWAVFAACLEIANAQGWAPSGEVDSPPAVERVEPTAAETPLTAPPTAAERDSLTSLRNRKGLNRKERRAMGLTYWSMRAEMRAMQEEGLIDDVDQTVVSARLMERLRAKHPEAYQKVSFDEEKMENLFELIRAWVEFIIGLFAMVS